MPEQITLKARWSERKETVEDCAAKLCSFLKQLAKSDELFAKGWLKCSRTLQSDVEPITISIEALREALEKGRSRRDSDKSIIEDLGFRSGRLWNGSEAEPAHISVHCGAYVHLPTLPAPNDVWVELPNEGSAAARLLRLESLAEIISVVVENWDPDWGWISTNKIDANIYQENPYLGQKAGWFTYVSARYGQLPKLPQHCTATRLGNFGNLIAITTITSGLRASNPEHVSSIRQLSEVLGKVGMLSPTPHQINRK